MLASRINNLINNYPDFPKKGILFKDITPILSKPKIFSEVIDQMSSLTFYEKADALIAIDARGFLIGSALALKLNKPLVLARKPGKLPGDISTKTYELEYGTNSLSIQNKLLDGPVQQIYLQNLEIHNQNRIQMA